MAGSEGHIPPGGKEQRRAWGRGCFSPQEGQEHRGAGTPQGPPRCWESQQPQCVCAHVCVHAGVYARVRISQGPRVYGCVRAYLPLFLKILQSVHLAKFKL